MQSANWNRSKYSKIKFGFVYIKDWSKTNYIINKKDNNKIIKNDDNINYSIKYHQNINDKFEMFNKFIKHWKTVVYENINDYDEWNQFNDNFLFLIDTMDQDISKQFNATANRWIILQNGKIVFKTPIFPSSKHINLIDNWLENNAY